MSDPHSGAPSGAEGIHLPGPSWWPLTLAIGLALLLTGLVLSLVMVAVGALVGLASLGLWVRDARREYHALHD